MLWLEVRLHLTQMATKGAEQPSESGASPELPSLPTAMGDLRMSWSRCGTLELPLCGARCQEHHSSFTQGTYHLVPRTGHKCSHWWITVFTLLCATTSMNRKKPLALKGVRSSPNMPALCSGTICNAFFLSEFPTVWIPCLIICNLVTWSSWGSIFQLHHEAYSSWQGGCARALWMWSRKVRYCSVLGLIFGGQTLHWQREEREPGNLLEVWRKM